MAARGALCATDACAPRRSRLHGVFADAPRALLLDDGRLLRACARQLVAEAAPAAATGEHKARPEAALHFALPHGAGAAALAASPDGALLAVAERVGSIAILCARTLALRGTLALPVHTTVRRSLTQAR